MLKDLDAGKFRAVYIVCGYTDLRFGIDGLANKVQSEFKLDPFDKDTLFLFCGRRCDRLKALHFDKDGFVLYYKRLDAGGRYQWPRSTADVRPLSRQEFRWLMKGLAIDQPKAIKAGKSIGKNREF